MTADPDAPLSPPEPVAAVSSADAEREVVVAPDDLARIDALVAELVDGIVRADPGSREYLRRIDDLTRIGDREVRATAAMSAQLLVNDLGSNGTVSSCLSELRRTIEAVGPESTKRGSARRAEKAQRRVQEVVAELQDAGATLNQGNAVVGQQQRALGTQLQSLRQYACLAERLDTALQARIDALAATDPARAQALRDDALWAIRQRHHDLVVHLAVTMQGYSALEVVAANNRELIRAVRIATTTTLAALQTAVAASSIADGWHDVLAVLDEVDRYTTLADRALDLTAANLRDRVANL